MHLFSPQVIGQTSPIQVQCARDVYAPRDVLWLLMSCNELCHTHKAALWAPFLPTETVGQQDAGETVAQPKHTLVPLLVTPVGTVCAEVSCGYSGLHLHGHFRDGHHMSGCYDRKWGSRVSRALFKGTYQAWCGHEQSEAPQVGVWGLGLGGWLCCLLMGGRTRGLGGASKWTVKSVDTQKLRAKAVYPLIRSRSPFVQPSAHPLQDRTEVSVPLYRIARARCQRFLQCFPIFS